MALPRLPRKNAETPPATDSNTPALPSAAESTPVKRRRRPAMYALGIALIVVGALGAWYITDRLSTTSEVVVAAVDIQEGQVITATDLTTTDVNVPAGSAIITGSQKDTLVGQRATSALQKGALVAPNQVSGQALPEAGFSIVGVKVAPGQVPSQNVDPGDPIQIVGTPKNGDEPPAGDAPTITGQIQTIGQPATDASLVIDVLVPSDQAATLASLSATGRIGVILIPQEG